MMGRTHKDDWVNLLSGGRGRGRGKIRWSGSCSSSSSTCSLTSSAPEAFDWEKIKRSLMDANSCPDREMGAILNMTDVEKDLLQKIKHIVKFSLENKVTVEVSQILHKHLDTIDSPYNCVFTLAVLSDDFREGKAKGITWNVLNSFLKYKEVKNDKLENPGTDLQDQVFLRFSSQPNVSVLKLAVRIFGLTSQKMRYQAAIIRFCQEGNFKKACDLTVALELFDHFDINIFCLPLLLVDKPSTMESYLDHSPKAVDELIKYLDFLSEEDNGKRVSDLVCRYPKIKATGSSKLSHKPLDNMIKKMVSKWNLGPHLHPASSKRWACKDIYYWVKQMFSIDSEQHNLQLVNWRELMEKKVDENNYMQEILVNTLLQFDMHEAKYWSAKYGICSELFQGNQFLDAEECWEDKVETSYETEYFQMPKDVEVVYVDTLEMYEKFIGRITDCKNSILGLDAEFMSVRSSEQKISLLQLSTHEVVHILDWEVLPSILENKHFLMLIDTVFSDPGMMIVGYGVWGDIKLLSKSFPQFSKLMTVSKSVVDLEGNKANLTALLKLTQSNIRGLSGLCHAVLGLPLNKAEQIADWSRRPLRESQVIYAALDAYICVEIYSTLLRTAKEMDHLEKFNKILFTVVKSAKENGKSKSKDKASKATLEEQLPNLVTPLIKTPTSPQEVRLVCDNMLQGLCRRLRLFGVDCLALDNGQDHMDCVKLASDPVTRYALSRGTPAAKISKQLPVGHTLDIKSNDLDMQVEEVFRYFNIVAVTDDIFSRCVLCNGGHYYLLPRNILKSLADRLEERNSIRNYMISPEDDAYDECFQDYELDKFDDDYNSDGNDASFPISQPEYSGYAGKRWETVQVTSYYTGVDKEGKVNMYTGDTDEGVRVQVSCMARTTIEKYEQFWVCGSCGKVYFEGSHWGKATEKFNSTVKQHQDQS